MRWNMQMGKYVTLDQFCRACIRILFSQPINSSGKHNPMIQTFLGPTSTSSLVRGSNKPLSLHSRSSVLACWTAFLNRLIMWNLLRGSVFASDFSCIAYAHARSASIRGNIRNLQRNALKHSNVKTQKFSTFPQHRKTAGTKMQTRWSDGVTVHQSPIRLLDSRNFLCSSDASTARKLLETVKNHFYKFGRLLTALVERTCKSSICQIRDTMHRHCKQFENWN